jgi:hypothetical protein
MSFTTAMHVKLHNIQKWGLEGNSTAGTVWKPQIQLSPLFMQPFHNLNIVLFKLHRLHLLYLSINKKVQMLKYEYQIPTVIYNQQDYLLF